MSKLNELLKTICKLHISVICIPMVYMISLSCFQDQFLPKVGNLKKKTITKLRSGNHHTFQPIRKLDELLDEMNSWVGQNPILSLTRKGRQANVFLQFHAIHKRNIGNLKTFQHLTLYHNAVICTASKSIGMYRTVYFLNAWRYEKYELKYKVTLTTMDWIQKALIWLNP